MTDALLVLAYPCVCEMQGLAFERPICDAAFSLLSEGLREQVLASFFSSSPTIIAVLHAALVVLL